MTAALQTLEVTRTERVFLVTKLVLAGAPRILTRDAARYLLRETLIFYRAKHAYRIYGFCFLPDRVHLVISLSSEAALGPAMKDIWSGFSRRVNRRWCRTGAFLRSKYLAEVLADPPAVRRALVYIHDRPILRGLMEPACRAPMTSAAPYRKGLGDQLVELYRTHETADHPVLRDAVLEVP